MKIRLSTTGLLTSLTAILLAMGAYLQWQLMTATTDATQRQLQYEKAMEVYEHDNVFYDPQAAIAWLIARQNGQGYFVPNPDLLHEPSQLNQGTLRATRYALTTLHTLGGMRYFDRAAAIEFILSNYLPDLTQADTSLPSDIYSSGPYAAFRTHPEGSAGVRPTMDALIALKAMNALGHHRLNLERIKRYILAHQNTDGGFWDEHYPDPARASSMKCTSFALRALGVIQAHTNVPMESSFKQRVATFIARSRDPSTGGYGDMPGEPARDGYDTFRAFITLWNLGGIDSKERRAFVASNMDLQNAIDYLMNEHYLPKFGAFSRLNTSGERAPSLKATHLVTWFLTSMDRADRLDRDAITRFVAGNENQPGEFGADIYSTYSAIGTLIKLDAATQPLPKPVAPPPFNPPYPPYIPYALIFLAVATGVGSYFRRKRQLESANRALAQQAARDGLTGTFNRTKLEELLRHEMDKAARYNTALSIIFFDVDHFKHVNDKHGHLAGDVVLRKLSEHVAHAIREPDILARWGGEEFVIAAPETPLEGGRQLAEKLQLTIADMNFPHAGNLTCSFGVTQHRKGDNFDTFTHRADDALYQAKEQGRNRVEAA